SADGTEILFSLIDRQETWALPALGGDSRRVLGGVEAVQSLDGETFYYSKWNSSLLFKSDRSGLKESSVCSFPSQILPGRKLFYPEGNVLLVMGFVAGQNDVYLFNVHLKTGEAKQIGLLKDINGRPSWGIPGKTLLLSRRVNSISNVWEYNLENKEMIQVSFGPGDDISPIMNPANREIYFVTSKESGSLHVFNMQTESSTEIFSELVSQPILSPDGKQLMYIRYVQPGRTEEVWVSNLDGTSRFRIATSSISHTGTWSRDGTKIGFMLDNKPFVADSNGRNVREIPIKNISEANSVLFTNNAKTIYVAGLNTAGSRMGWKADADGQKIEEFATSTIFSDSSPDYRYLVGGGEFENSNGIGLFSIQDKKTRVLIEDVNSLNIYFSDDGKAILYTVASPQEITFYSLPFENGRVTGEPHLLRKVAPKFPLIYRGNAFDYTRDLSTLVYARPTAQADVYLLSYK
ncbi:MAG TPA: hypothetical protein VH878_05670, partial [Thermodesulfobacteriota bacterium]